ncbi:hypothetical protein Pse7367_1277 [Thalassoporum mexicanum PCC 7367]|uniref:hypothetical protein n=1 Tax=Thalassoporum mexicanum TaxID=3457544 RepID=UPI00029FB1B5|nr:hypothetical protein [Pseudanabaena sp. PCC 7367]AFY69571.1 hypothetical protein Pse7367_1277 [Pseudanabaena sp. PCC 7367]
MKNNLRQTKVQWQEYKRLELLNALSDRSDRSDRTDLKDELKVDQDQPIANGQRGLSYRSIKKTATELVKHLKAGFSNLGDRLTKEPEVKVWQKYDRRGHVYWSAYDPITGQSTSVASEAEMRSWLEQLRLSAMYEKTIQVNLGWQ